MLLFFAPGFTDAQDEPQQAAAGKFDFKAQITWYTQRTYTDPWRHGYLIGEVTLNDFMFGESKRWGTGLSGWAKSLAPVYGQRVISNTTEFAFGTLIGDDARYRRLEKGGLVTRSLHATVGAFTARARTGYTRPAYSRIIAITAGTLIANRWRSDPKTGGDLTRALVFGVTDKVQDDLLREFSPELKQFGHGIWRKVPYTFRRHIDMGR
jgi:hypothetical protein